MKAYLVRWKYEMSNQWDESPMMNDQRLLPVKDEETASRFVQGEIFSKREAHEVEHFGKAVIIDVTFHSLGYCVNCDERYYIRLHRDLTCFQCARCFAVHFPNRQTMYESPKRKDAQTDDGSDG